MKLCNCLSRYFNVLYVCLSEFALTLNPAVIAVSLSLRRVRVRANSDYTFAYLSMANG